MAALVARGFAVAFLLLCFAGCAVRRGKVFEVVRGTPSYILRTPNTSEIPFDKVLREYNGFEPAHAFIDLRPLMEIRIENAYYKKGSSRRGLAGFLGTEVARYEILTDRLQLLSVEPMENRPRDEAPVQDLISTAVQRARTYRLYFEILFNTANKTHGSVLLAANSEAEMEQLATQLKHPETVCSKGSANCAVFPEACSVSVEMKVFVNGKDKTVIWGSKLGEIAGEHPQHLEVRRVFEGRLTPVHLNIHDADELHLPLLPGDRVSFR